MYGNYVLCEQGTTYTCNSSELVLCTHHEVHEHKVKSCNSDKGIRKMVLSMCATLQRIANLKAAGDMYTDMFIALNTPDAGEAVDDAYNHINRLALIMAQ